jgi:hypothetical protein
LLTTSFTRITFFTSLTWVAWDQVATKILEQVKRVFKKENSLNRQIEVKVLHKKTPK